MLKIKKNDTVQVVKGKDKGKKGRVLMTFPEKGRVLVEGVNMVKKHKRKTQNDQQGGIISIEMPLAIANIALFCKSCNRAVRIGFSLDKDKQKSRICKACKAVI